MTLASATLSMAFNDVASLTVGAPTGQYALWEVACSPSSELSSAYSHLGGKIFRVAW